MTGNGEQDLGHVLRNAGRRSEPPEGVAQSVRAAVEAQWREVVAQRTRRRRRIGMSLAAAAAFVAIGLWAARPLVWSPGASLAAVRVAAGTVQAKAGWLSSWGAVGPGQALHAGETLATADNGRVALALADDVSVRLDRDTQIVLVGTRRISISRGALYVDSGARTAAHAPELLVETPAGAVHHVGTQYETRVLGSEVRIAVREGRVELDTGGGAMHSASAGEQLTISSGGNVMRSAISPYDERWKWVSATAPPFNINGRSVAEFMTWAARELGRNVVYDDAQAQADAERVLLNGSISGLSPEEALAAVLPTTPLRSEMRNGQLVVSLSAAAQ